MLWFDYHNSGSLHLYLHITETEKTTNTSYISLRDGLRCGFAYTHGNIYSQTDFLFMSVCYEEAKNCSFKVYQVRPCIKIYSLQGNKFSSKITQIYTD